ncbi:MAG TPA: peptide-methionine (R)-S-oxide reductase MsrB [Pirellulaceae bacterium]|nr:peptide-methionine (R)-S-oxide reductase MsrB [Pirellulaceae bacterium]HMO92610.1 peptide-methionine (R)-S-oxide reductase MsrB [Pirellulaceae bacterium]HMP70697.1 peptide-methionine (R)-S-oxide reductase MsrB [Pirellulaceae bacterium]
MRLLLLSSFIVGGLLLSGSGPCKENCMIRNFYSNIFHQDQDSKTEKEEGASQQDTQAESKNRTQKGKRPAMVVVRVFNDQGELVQPIQVPKIVKSSAEWKAQLTTEQYRITRRAGTEAPFCGNLLDNKQEGVYTCVCCGLPLFSSDSKFDSGTGWPSFFQPVAAENLVQKVDRSHGMVRTEICCTRCDAHLGHVFTDGPRPTGLRFCLNSESLEFTNKEDLASLADPGINKSEQEQGASAEGAKDNK